MNIKLEGQSEEPHSMELLPVRVLILKNRQTGMSNMPHKMFYQVWVGNKWVNLKLKKEETMFSAQ